MGLGIVIAVLVGTLAIIGGFLFGIGWIIDHQAKMVVELVKSAMQEQAKVNLRSLDALGFSESRQSLEANGIETPEETLPKENRRMTQAEFREDAELAEREALALARAASRPN